MREWVIYHYTLHSGEQTSSWTEQSSPLFQEHGYGEIVITDSEITVNRIIGRRIFDIESAARSLCTIVESDFTIP